MAVYQPAINDYDGVLEWIIVQLRGLLIIFVYRQSVVVRFRDRESLEKQECFSLQGQ